MAEADLLSDDIVAAATDGDRGALERLSEAVAPRVRAMVVARLCAHPGQYHAVEDITQGVLLAMTAGIARLQRRTVAGLKAFLSGIVGNKVADFLRTGRRTGRPLDPGTARTAVETTLFGLPSSEGRGGFWEFLSASGTSPLSAVDRANMVERMMTELGALKDEYREAITLAFFDQLPTADIAQLMGISRPAASMLLIRAVKTLRRNMTGSSQVLRVEPHGA